MYLALRNFSVRAILVLIVKVAFILILILKAIIQRMSSVRYLVLKVKPGLILRIFKQIWAELWSTSLFISPVQAADVWECDELDVLIEIQPHLFYKSFSY